MMKKQNKRTSPKALPKNRRRRRVVLRPEVIPSGHSWDRLSQVHQVLIGRHLSGMLVLGSTWTKKLERSVADIKMVEQI